MQTKTRGAHVELTGATFDSLEAWRRSQEKIPPRSEAVRFLLAIALNSFEPKQESAAA